MNLSSGRSARVHEDRSLPPRLSEDYYEWIDLLEAIDTARDRFVMFEVGAGYGRWSVNAAKAIARRTTPCAALESRFVLVESDRSNTAAIRRHFEANGLDLAAAVIRRAAVAGSAGTGFFPLYEGNYGFHVLRVEEHIAALVIEQGWDQVAIRNTGQRYQVVELVTLDRLIQETTDAAEIVDFIDMDIQGTELEAIEAALPFLNGKARRLHVATHSPDVEEGLYDLLVANGWRISRFLPCFKPCFAEYGKFLMCDGIISACNHRFA